MSKILILANVRATISNFRKEVISTFLEQGYSVTAGYAEAEDNDDIAALGCRVVDLPVSRHGKNILKDIKLLNACKALIKAEKPDIVLTYTVKPNIYGSMACQFLHVPYINNVTGLGSVLQRQSALSKLILDLQKNAYKKSSCVFFQNSANCDTMKDLGVVAPTTKTLVLPGSGVNLQKHTYEKYPVDDGITRFVLVSRVRVDKGYGEYLDAAEAIKAKYPNTEFHAVGWYEEKMDNRVAILHDQGTIIFHGEKTQEEVHEIIKDCQCLIHPSYHEGMANVLLEAAAAGRPVIATDIPGCRETFDEGITGFGCKVKSSKSLIEAIEKFLQVPYEERIEMGRRGREKMEKEFDRQFVADIYTKEIERVLGEQANVH